MTSPQINKFELRLVKLINKSIVNVIHHQQNQQEKKPHKDAYSCGEYHYIKAQSIPKIAVSLDRGSQCKDWEQEQRSQQEAILAWTADMLRYVSWGRAGIFPHSAGHISG
jgi:hypothetical protein